METLHLIPRNMWLWGKCREFIDCDGQEALPEEFLLDRHEVPLGRSDGLIEKELDQHPRTAFKTIPGYVAETREDVRLFIGNNRDVRQGTS